MSSCENCNSVYSERNKLVSLVYDMSKRLGYSVGIKQHDGEEWEDDWRHVVFIDLPTGQVSWHIHDSELKYFVADYVPYAQPYNRDYDGHTTEEKYERVLAYARK